MYSIFLNSECRGCGYKLEPETVDTVSRMTIPPSQSQIEDYDILIKEIKLSQGLCLQTYSLHQRFVTIQVRAVHDKQAALLDWTKNRYDGIEVGTIRFTQYFGVGGSTGSYINSNYSQLQDYFRPNSKFGGYITSDFNNRIIGVETTNGGSSAYEMTLGLTLGNRHYDSWGANPQLWFNTYSVTGMREIVRGGLYDNNGTIGVKTLLFNGQIDYTGSVPSTVRDNFAKKFYHLANNRGDSSVIESAPTEVNTVGFCMFQFHGSYLIDSPRLLVAVENYLKKVGAI